MPTILFSRICLATVRLATAILVGVMLLSAGCNRGNQKPAPVPPPGVESREPVAVSASRGATLARIRRHQAIGNIDAAERELQAFLVRFPEDAEALVLAADFAATRGDTDQAVRLLDEAATHSPDDAPPWRTQAALLIAKQGRWDEAIGRLSAIVDEHPDFDQGRRHLAEVLNSRGFRFDANEQVRELCRHGGATSDLLGGLMVPTRAYTGFPIRANLDDADDIERVGVLNVVRDLVTEGDVRQAAQILGQSRLVKQENPGAVALYGKLLLDSQQFSAFAQWLENVPAACRRYPAYWMSLGGWAVRSRKHDQAVRLFAEAVLREPGDLAANDRITQALAAAGHEEASERFRKRGVQIDTLTRIARSIVSDPNIAIEAIDELSRGLQEVGRPLESLAWYQVALERMGAPAEAMRKLEEARKLVPNLDAPLQQEELLCGLALEDFPLDTSIADFEPSLESLPQAASDDWLEPSFVNVAAQVGLDFQYRNAPTPVEREFRIFQQIGSGVACVDYDLDGNIDFYFGQASAEPPDGRGTLPNQLARNLRDRFRNVTDAAACDDRGYSCGITSGDWNQDGFPDLVIGNLGVNTLLINQGDGTFRRRSGDAAWNDPSFTASLAIGDVSGDHLPDVYEANYLDDPRIFDPIRYHSDGTPIDLPGPLSFTAAVDRVFFSRPDGSMSGQVMGDESTAASGLGVLLTNIDGDVGNEVFVANDHTANHLWERVPDSDAMTPAFRNTAAARGLAYGSDGMPLGCMGIAAGDFDGNGRLDLHVTNFENQWSNHYMQNDAGFFDDLAIAFGLGIPSYKMLGFGTQALDYDSNSQLDFVVGNGHVEDYTAKGSAFEMPTQLFRLEGSQFVPLKVAGDESYWQAGHLSRGLAICDWNNDGRVDIAVTDLKKPVALLENRTATDHHWLQLKLVGTRCERDAIGATVVVSVAGRKLSGFVQSGDGYMSKNQSLVSFGLGKSDRADRIEITWPDGETQSVEDVGSNRRWLIVQGASGPFALDPGPRR